MSANVKIKRIYDDASVDDGKRVLVDRLWPRGITKEKAKLDEWMRAVAPSPGLRQWFAHRPERFDQFRTEYLSELISDPTRIEHVKRLLSYAEAGPLTLLYAAKDPVYNHAIVLLEVVLG